MNDVEMAEKFFWELSKRLRFDADILANLDNIDEDQDIEIPLRVMGHLAVAIATAIGKVRE